MHVAIFARQFFCFRPLQLVPVTIQHICPLPNFLPGQTVWHSLEHFMIW